MLEVKDAERLLKYLDMMFYPLRYKALPTNTLGWLCGEILKIMTQFQQEAVITKSHFAYFRYHEQHPDSVVLCSNATDIAAYEAAKRAVMIHINRLRKSAVTKR